MKKFIYALIALAIVVCVSCTDHLAEGDKYFSLASDAAKNDSIILAYSFAEKALEEYQKCNNEPKTYKARIFLSVLYFSTGQKDKAYETIEDLKPGYFNEEDYPLYSNYYRIKAYHMSVVQNDTKAAVALLDTLMYYDDKYAKSNKYILNLDRLNKCEILLNGKTTLKVQELLDSVVHSTILPSPVESQLYANKARLFEMQQKNDSAYVYAKKVLDNTSKIYEDIDNAVYALEILLRYDSLSNNLPEYIFYRNLLENLKDERQGESIRYGMAFAKEQNMLENIRTKARAEKKMWISISLSILLVGLIILLILIQKHKNVLTENKIIQLECDRLDAEAFRRKLENELLVHKINSKSDELKKAHDEILGLSQRLAMNKSDDGKQDTSYLQRLLGAVNTDYPYFNKLINEKFPEITKTESILASLIKLNLSSEEITTAMSISKSGLIKARYRLRKRLNIETSAELDEFIARL